MISCSVCEGKGGWTEYISNLEPGMGGPYTSCFRCNGIGKISYWEAIRHWFWERTPEWYLDFLYERSKRND